MQSDFKELMKRSKPLLSEAAITVIVAKLAHLISKEYTSLINVGEVPVIICVLKGAYPFFSDLTKKLPFPHDIEFIRCESYKKNRKSDNHEIFFSPNVDLEDRCLLVIEDIVDTGLTAEMITETLECALPRDIQFCTLIHKPHKATCFRPDFVGFSYIKDNFLFGYGLDLHGFWRQLPGVYEYESTNP